MPARTDRTAMARATFSALTEPCWGQFGSPLRSITLAKNSVRVVPGLTTRTSIG